MSTRTDAAEAARVAAFKQRMSRPIEIVIEDAVAYWLADRGGQMLGQKSDRTVAPFAMALEMIDSGVDPDELVVYARLKDGSRYEVGSGVHLAGMARRSAGIPAGPA
jgi:hypothetical protein